MGKKVIVVGAGLGGMCTAIRLAHKGYEVTVLEKYHQAGGRLNRMEKDGFVFDTGPSFFSMSYEFKAFFDEIGIENPLKFNELNPLYSVYFEGKKDPIMMHKDLEKLALEFPHESQFVAKAQKYLKAAKEIFHDTEHRIVKRNYKNKLEYLAALTTVPLKHGPKLFRSMWTELENHFDTEEVKVIFSLVAFFLGSTPFDTPAVYSLLNYSELIHDGYWNVQGGMYQIAQTMVRLMEEKKVKVVYNTNIVGYSEDKSRITGLIDQNNQTWKSDLYVVNADAASFRGEILHRKAYSEEKLDAMDWTLAPFTIYLGVKGKINNLHHHNYFLGNNFKSYADDIFKTSVAPEKPYYYVNVSSKSNPECAPPDGENIFILCPVPDLRFKPDWSDSEQLADTIIADMSERIGFDLKANTVTRTIWDPPIWRDTFRLYKGSGLGLAHGLNQVAAMRPSNKDEKLSNLYYVGASTVPGTGLPIVVISSKLVTERIESDHGAI